jgi:hypothetical protein
MAFKLLASFAHRSLIYLDGQLHGVKPLKLDFAANRYLAAYAGSFGGTNSIHRDEGNDVDRSDYAGVYALYACDLAPDLEENGVVILLRQLTIRLNLKSGAALRRRSPSSLTRSLGT